MRNDRENENEYDREHDREGEHDRDREHHNTIANTTARASTTAGAIAVHAMQAVATAPRQGYFGIMRLMRAWWILGGFVVIGACARGAQMPDEGDLTGGAPSNSSSSSATGTVTSSAAGTGGMTGSSSAAGTGGTTGSSAAGGAGTGGMTGSSSASSSSVSSSSSSSASSSSVSSSSSSSMSSSSGAGGAGPTCPGAVVDWNWNTATAPGNLIYSGSSWSVGAATAGPSDGLTYLATVPGGNYPDNANDWARLPTIDLSSYQSCQFRVTVELWRNSEKFGLVNYDGGNLQYTTDPNGNTGWAAVPGPSMAYDGMLTQCGGNCLVNGQQTWTSSANPKAKIGTYQSTAPPGNSLTLRFTFVSDFDNTNGPLPGLYIRRVLVEAF